MGKKAIVIDKSDAGRARLASQLKQVGFDSTQPFRTSDEAIGALMQSYPTESLDGVFCTLSEGAQKIADFTTVARNIDPNIPIYVVGNTLAVTEMKVMVQAGVSQILLSPFSIKQLEDKIKLAEIFHKSVQDESKSIPKDRDFRFHFEEFTDEVSVIALNGWLTEQCVLPPLKPKNQTSTLVVDLEKLIGINSFGIRLWMLWIKDLAESGYMQIDFENIHTPILKNFSMVKGFCPFNASIGSFYLYYSDLVADGEREFKFRQGVDFDASNMRLPKIIQVLEKSKSIQFKLDPHFNNILKFYRGKIDLNSSGIITR